MLEKRHVPQLNDECYSIRSLLVVVNSLAAELLMIGPWTVQHRPRPFFWPKGAAKS